MNAPICDDKQFTWYAFAFGDIPNGKNVTIAGIRCGEIATGALDVTLSPLHIWPQQSAYWSLSCAICLVGLQAISRNIFPLTSHWARLHVTTHRHYCMGPVCVFSGKSCKCSSLATQSQSNLWHSMLGTSFIIIYFGNVFLFSGFFLIRAFDHSLIGKPETSLSWWLLSSSSKWVMDSFGLLYRM